MSAPTAEQVIQDAIDTLLSLGGFDGAHHKQYALDQVLRVLTRCPTTTQHATDCNGKTYSFTALGESAEYKVRLERHRVNDYEWDSGVAP